METELIQRYEAQGGELLAHAESIMIVDDTTRELAVEFTSNARKAIKSIEVEFRPDIEKAHTLHKDLLSRLKKLVEPFKRAQVIVDAEISRDFLERDRIRREEERKAREIADAELKRQERQLADEAEACIADGDLEGAQSLLESVVIVNPGVPVAQTQKTTQTAAGSTTVKQDIKVELVDKQDVIIAVFQGKLPGVLLTVDLGAAKRYAKANSVMVMPGFQITKTVAVSGRIG